MNLKRDLSIHSLCGDFSNLVLDCTLKKEINWCQVNMVAIQCCRAFQTNAA